NVDTLGLISDTPGRNWMVSTTGVLNNTTALEISVGSAHNSLAHYTTSDAWTRAGTGMSSLPMLFPGAIQNDYLPQMTFAGGRIGSPAFLNSSQAPFTNFNTTYDVVANLTKVIGAHALKAGFYYQHSLKPQSAFASFNGAINFDNSSSNPFDSQNGFANAALGVYNSFSQASTYAKPEWQYANIEWYLQDNWKTTDKLTLDYGVRFYYVTPQWDGTGQASTFLPEKFSASTAVRLFRPAVINGVRVGYDATSGQVVDSTYIGRIVPGSGDRFQGTFQAGKGVDKTLSDGAKFAVSPRVGFAYDLTGKQTLVARGSFGIFYDRPQGNIVFDMVTNPPGMFTPSLQWGLVSTLASTTPLYATSGVNPTVYNWKLPTVYQWNVGLQVQLPYQFTLDISHVGSESRNLIEQHQINALPYGTTFLASSQDPTRGQTCSGCSALSTLPGGNALPTDFLRPDQGYGGIRLWEFTAYSNYKALQTSVNRRFSKGLMATVSYVYSKAQGIANDDYGAARIDGKDKEANYGILAINRPHNFVVSFVYQIPSTAHGALGYLTNDWQVSGNYRWMSGNPYIVNYSIAGVGSANITGSDQGARIVLNGDAGKGSSSDPYKQLNTAVFGPPQTGSIGMESPRLFVYGPPINNLDMSISKSFPLGGKRRFEIRLDAFNALNHLQFSTINATANFNSMSDPTIINLPYDASGNLVRQTGFGTVAS
ncbi:MAG: TonB-dependent receptor, partial [Acidobacteria bacterium]|nr:TonB-dependent receptor [Acidobacteriota bacterium]